MSGDETPEPLPDSIPPWVEQTLVEPEVPEVGPATAEVPPPPRPDGGAASPVQVGAPAFDPPPVEELDAAIRGYELRTMFFANRTGALYRAVQPHLDRDVAIKVLPPSPGPDKDAYVVAFENEAKTMARLNHPNIVKVYDFGQTADGLPYFVMEYVEGAILGQVMKNGQLTMEHLYGWVPQICEGLQYAHLQYVTHCDITPANILLTKEGEVKVTNFGLSQLNGQGTVAAETIGTSLSASALNYAAPEIRTGSAPDYRSDIYSVGVVLYEMLTGILPQPGQWQPPSQVSGVDSRFDEIVYHAMAEDREARWQSTLDISSRVQQIQANPPGPKRPKLNFG